jgi:peroxiredoxin
MTISIGDRVPEGTLTEFIENADNGQDAGPQAFKVSELVKGKKIVLFAVPGAFTPTCTTKHVVDFIRDAEQIKAKGVDEIWCVAVNDAFVMGAWGRDTGATGIIRLLADGAATWTTELGLELDLVARGLGVRSRRYSAILDDGVVKQLNVEEGGEYKISGTQTILSQL